MLLLGLCMNLWHVSHILRTPPFKLDSLPAKLLSIVSRSSPVAGIPSETISMRVTRPLRGACMDDMALLTAVKASAWADAKPATPPGAREHVLSIYEKSHSAGVRQLNSASKKEKCENNDMAN